MNDQIMSDQIMRDQIMRDQTDTPRFLPNTQMSSKTETMKTKTSLY